MEGGGRDGGKGTRGEEEVEEQGTRKGERERAAQSFFVDLLANSELARST